MRNILIFFPQHLHMISWCHDKFHGFQTSFGFYIIYLQFGDTLVFMFRVRDVGNSLSFYVHGLKMTQQQEYHFSFYEILVSEALAMQIGLILKNSCKWNKLTKYSKKTYKCRLLWHRVPNIVWGEKKKFRRQRRKKKEIRFAVCHRELTAKLIFAVCQQLGTR